MLPKLQVRLLQMGRFSLTKSVVFRLYGVFGETKTKTL